MKRLLDLIGACVLGGLLLAAMSMWLNHQAVYAWTPPLVGCETIDSDISSPTEVWDLARAPCYRIATSTVAIQSGAWLTIEAGVWVYFDADSRLQVNPGGGLTAIGTDLAPITLTSAATTGQEKRCDWNGIIINSDVGPPVRIQHAVIEYACVGIDPGGRRNLTITHNIFRYNGNGTASGAIVGDTDNSSISHNTMYSCQNGIVLNEAGDNELRDNTIHTIDHDGIAFARGGVLGGRNNHIISNTIHHCGRNGIRLEDGDLNVVQDNFLYQNGEAGIVLDQQSNALLQDNLVSGNAWNTGALAAVVITNSSSNIMLSFNQILSNGHPGDYQAALYIQNMTSTLFGSNLLVNSNVIYDVYGSGIYYAGDNSNSASIMQNNAICALPSFLDNRRSGHTIDGRYNWWGTNAPALGVHYAGSVDINPWITLALATAPMTMPADIGATATVRITMTDGAGHTVPDGARNVRLVASTGTVVPSMVTLDDNGQASAIFTLTGLPPDDRVVISATAFCDYTEAATITVERTNVAIAKTTPAAQVMRGEPLLYTIEYSNTSDVMARNVYFTDTLPGGTRYQSHISDLPALPCSGCVVGGPGPLTWGPVDLPARASHVVVLTLSTDNTSCGDLLTNNVVIGASTAENVYTDNAAQSQPVTVVGADVTVGKTTVLTEALCGDVITYTITYRNGGDAPAENVEITDILPPGTSYVSDDSGLPGGSGPLTWDAGTLPANSPSYSFNLILQVNSNTPCSTTLVNTATIATTTPECDNLPNEDQSEAVHVVGHVDLIVVKDDDVGPVTSRATLLTADKRAALEHLLWKSRGRGPLALSQHRDFVLAGDLITYTILIVNDGDYTATNVVLSETLPLYTQYVGINWTHVAGRTYTQMVGTLPPGAGRSYYFVVQIDDPIPLGVNDLDNLVCGWSDDDDLHPEDNCNHEDTPVRHPRLTITKTGDALSKVGDDVVYTIVVCNPGDVTMIKQSVADNLIPGVNGVFGPSLAPGVCESHDFSRTVQPGDLDPLVNVATARYYVDGRPDRALVASDDHSVNLFQPRVEVEKGGDTLSKIGDAVIYHFWITNTSSADSPDLILESVLDTLMGNVTGGFSAACGRLAPGESCHVTAGYTVQPGDPDPLLNTVTVLYHPEGFPNDITASDDHVVNLFQPDVEVEKGNVGAALSKIGDTITYTFRITNTSSLDAPALNLASVIDTLLGDLTGIARVNGCDPLPSNPPASCYFTVPYIVQPGDPDPLPNTVTVLYHPNGFPNDITDSDDHEVNLFRPGVEVEKGNVGAALSKIGDTITYTFRITNTSSLDAPALNLASVIDTLLGDITVEARANGCDPLPSNPPASCYFTVPYTVQAGDPDPLPNTVTVLYHPNGFPNDITDSDDHSVNLFQPTVAVEKGGDTLSKIGDGVTYHFWITNTSSLDTPMLNLESVVDTLLGDLTAEARANGCDPLLTTGDSCHFTVLYTVQPGDPDPLPNTVTVLYHPEGFPNDITDSDDHSVNLFQPTVAVEKGGDTLSKIGDGVTYHFWITNTSSADSPDLILDSATDVGNGWPGPGLPSPIPPDCERLAPGESCHFTVPYTIQPGDPDPLRNTFTVHYHPEGFPNDITDTDDHLVNLFTPSVRVDKTGPVQAYVDNTITYTFRITNTGSADSPALILDSVTDVGDGWPGLGDLTAVARANGCDPLPPGNSCNFAVPYTIQPSDPPRPLLTNTVTVNFHPNGFTNVITDFDYHTVAISVDVDLVVTKNDDVGPTTPTSARLAADKQAAVERLLRATRKRAPLAPAQHHREFVGPGDLITYTIVVINTGQSVATNVVLTETLPLYTTYVGYGWQQVGATRNYTMSLPNLPPQVGRVVTFVVRIDDPLPPEVHSIINYVCGFSAEPDSDDTDNCRYTDAPVLNLDVDKEANPTAILPGDQVTFTITLSNPNQFTGSITITDDLPDGFTWITDTAETIGLTRVLTAPVVIWRASTFTIGERISFTLTAQASSMITTCGRWVTNTVTATVRVGDQEYNWTATAGVWIQCHIDLLVTKDDDVGPITSMSMLSLAPEKQAVTERVLREARERAPIAPAQHREFVESGDLITYTITIANVGAYTVTNAVLSETIPLYTEYVGYGWTNLGGRTYITTVGTLPPGVGHVYFITVRVDDSIPFGVSNLINYVCGWGDEPDDYLDNNCNYEDTPVRTGGKLYVTNRGEDPDGPAGSGIPGAIDVFDTTNFDHITTIPDVGEDPWGMATRDRYLFETDFDQVDSQSALYVVDTVNDTVVASVTLACRHPAHVAVYDGYVYVACHSGPPPIEVIRAEPPWDIVDELYLNQHQVYEFGLFGVTADTNRGLIYFTKSDFGGLGIWALDPSGGITLTYPTNEAAGEKPFSILYNPNDDLVYVAFAQLGQVWIFDPDGFQLLERIDTETQETVDEGHGGQGLVALGQCVFASNYLSASVTVIVNGSCVEPVAVHVAAPPAGFERVYLPMVVSDFSGQPVQPAQPDVVTISLNGRRPKGMTAAHNRLFVTLPLEDRVAIIDTETLTVIGEIAVIGEHPHTVILVEAD